MTATIDSELLVLHGLAVKKAGSAESVGTVLGMDPAEVERSLGRAMKSGRAIGARATYMLTPVGRSYLDEQYPSVYADLRANPGFIAAYERFEVVNKEILDLFTRWQTATVAGQSIPNDHQDEDYDNKIIDRLGDIHERSAAIFESFAAVEPRLSVYKYRFEAAYDRILDGEKEWVSGAKIDSYHTVWFELHEDILRLLGRERHES